MKWVSGGEGVLACDMTEGVFEVPGDFEVESVLKDGRVFFARGDQPLLDVRGLVLDAVRDLAG